MDFETFQESQDVFQKVFVDKIILSPLWEDLSIELRYKIFEYTLLPVKVGTLWTKRYEKDVKCASLSPPKPLITVNTLTMESSFVLEYFLETRHPSLMNLVINILSQKMSHRILVRFEMDEERCVQRRMTEYWTIYKGHVFLLSRYPTSIHKTPTNDESVDMLCSYFLGRHERIEYWGYCDDV